MNLLSVLPRARAAPSPAEPNQFEPPTHYRLPANACCGTGSGCCLPRSIRFWITATHSTSLRCCREYVDRRRSLCFSVCASRAGLTPSPTCPSLGKVASAKAEMWPLRQPNGDATRQPSSVRTDGGFLHVSEHHSSAAR